MWAPRALEGGHNERHNGREDSEWERSATKGMLPEDVEVRVSLHPVFHCFRLLHAQWTRRISCQIYQMVVRLEQRRVS